MINNKTFKFLLNSVKPFKPYIALHLFVIIYNAIDVSFWPYLTKVLINKLAASDHEHLIANITPITLWLILFSVLPGFVWRICDYAWTIITPEMKKKITAENMDYLIRHSNNFFQNNFSGALANRIKDLTNCTPHLIETILYSFINVFLMLIIAFFALLFVHKLFAFGLALWAILFIFMAIKGSKITAKMSSEISDQSSKIMGNVVDVLGNITNVKFFSKSSAENNRLNNLGDEYTKLSRKRSFFLIKFYTLHGLSFSVYFVFCIVLLIYLYSKGEVTLGDFAMIFTINNFVIHAMWQAANMLRTFLEELGSVNQALETIHQPIEINDGNQILEVKKGEIIFENVEFSYKNSAPIFLNKNITIKAGQKIGLVGHSGSGKSTFINLILRFFDLSKGRILIDGQDISKVTQNSLRDAIGVIPQDPSLFHRSLSENISYGKDNTQIDEIRNAAVKAHADKFIENLPQKYDSLVGERGVKLSGGQRQRIAIARAFLKNAPILILDEATSALDSVTENIIQESLQNLMQNKTTLVIAHRLSTLKMMDRILVFDHGKIVEDGTHEELLSLNGTYKKLWNAQIGKILTNKVENAEAFLIYGEL